MDFITGALPNVMFLVGIIAIGIGLGMEFKIVEVKGNLSRSGRVGAFGIGALLIALSIVLYTRPSTTAETGTDAVQAGITGPISAAATVAAPTAAAPTAAPETAPAELPTAAPEATPTELPTATPEAATVRVPELRDRPLREVEMILDAVGLRLGERASSCDALGVAAEDTRRVKKDRVACQSVQPGQRVAEGATIDVVIGEGEARPGPRGDDDDEGDD